MSEKNSWDVSGLDQLNILYHVMSLPLEFGNNVTGVAAVICLFDVIPLRVIDRFIDTLENSVYVLVVVRSSEVWDWSV